MNTPAGRSSELGNDDFAALFEANVDALDLLARSSNGGVLRLRDKLLTDPARIDERVLRHMGRGVEDDLERVHQTMVRLRQELMPGLCDSDSDDDDSCAAIAALPGVLAVVPAGTLLRMEAAEEVQSVLLLQKKAILNELAARSTAKKVLNLSSFLCTFFSAHFDVFFLPFCT